MWSQLFLLTLCGTPTLLADMCDGLPAGATKGSELFGSNAPLSFKLSVRSSGPAFRITIRSTWQLKGDSATIDGAHAGDIEVARCKDGEPLQALPITADQPIGFGATFRADDVNFDGYRDFSVVTEYAASSGEIRSYWVYDPGSGMFVQNDFTRELRCGPAAARNDGSCQVAAFIDFHPENREISRRYAGLMRGCPNTALGEGERYRVENNRLILIHKQEIEQVYKGATFQSCTVSVSDLIGGTMRVTSVRRYDLRGRALK